MKVKVNKIEFEKEFPSFGDLREIRYKDKIIREGLCFFVNNFAIVVVGVLTLGNEKPIDWSAYIGGSSDNVDYESLIEFTAKYGAKLPEKFARMIFSDWNEIPYRY